MQIPRLPGNEGSSVGRHIIRVSCEPTECSHHPPFGTAGKRIDLQKDFLSKLTDTLTAGVGALVDADMSAEAARLQALQVQQQLGAQALNIANSAPQVILSLFKG